MTVWPQQSLGGTAGAFAVAAVLAACGGRGEPDGGLGSEAGPLDAAPPDIGVTPPDIPWLADGRPPVETPVLTPCPEGWREVAPSGGDAVTTCDPYPPDGPDTCPAGEAHFPGEPGCAPVGSPCPAGGWPDGLPDDGTVLFVRSGESGDGTRDRPLGRITDALAMASSGMTVALAPGRYRENLTIPEGVTLRGTCAASTELAAAAMLSVVSVPSRGVSLRDLSITNTGRIGLYIGGGEVTLDGVIASNNVVAGIQVERGGHLAAHSLVVRDTFPGVTSHNAGVGVSLLGASSADIRRAVILGNHEAGILVGESGSALDLADAAILDTQERERDGKLGNGLSVIEGATARVEHSILSRNRSAAVLVARGDASVELTDVLIRDTREEADMQIGGHGVVADANGHAVLSRVTLDRNREVALVAKGGGSSVLASDIVVRDTQERANDHAAGRGVQAEDGADAEVTRALITRSRDVGVAAFDGASLRMADVIVRDTLELSMAGTGGRGLVVQSGSMVAVSGATLAGNRDVAVYVSGNGSDLALEDVALLDTEGMTGTDYFGRGVTVQVGATLTATRLLVRGNRGISVYAMGEGTRARLTDTVVDDTLPRGCATTSCPADPAGIGVGSYFQASVEMERFAVTDADLCGLQIAEAGRIRLMTGLVADNPVGVCLQVDGYDVALLMNHVLYRDNGTTLEATSFAVPGAADPAGL